MTKTTRLSLEEIAEYFGELEDPKSSINLLHPLISVVMIALMATLAGASGPTGIAIWAGMKKDLLLKCLDLPNGIPRNDVFRRVLAALKPDVFQACFVQWIGSLGEAADMGNHCQGSGEDNGTVPKPALIQCFLGSLVQASRIVVATSGRLTVRASRCR